MAFLAVQLIIFVFLVSFVSFVSRLFLAFLAVRLFLRLYFARPRSLSTDFISV
jgi:hypothetical protein